MTSICFTNLSVEDFNQKTWDRLLWDFRLSAGRQKSFTDAPIVKSILFVDLVMDSREDEQLLMLSY